MYYGIPTAMVKETSSRFLFCKAEKTMGGEELSSNGKSIFSLIKVLRNDSNTGSMPEENYYIEVEDGVHNLILSVDQIVAEAEAVIEPLPVIARSAELIAGAAPITSDRIMLIINVPELLSKYSQQY